MHQLLVRFSKRSVNFLIIISQLPFALWHIVHFRSFLLYTEIYIKHVRIIAPLDT